jgi:hypothetical protein
MIFWSAVGRRRTAMLPLLAVFTNREVDDALHEGLGELKFAWASFDSAPGHHERSIFAAVNWRMDSTPEAAL